MGLRRSEHGNARGRLLIVPNRFLNSTYVVPSPLPADRNIAELARANGGVYEPATNLSERLGCLRGALLPQAHAWSPGTVGLDEDDARGFKCVAEGSQSAGVWPTGRSLEISNSRTADTSLLR